MDKDNLDGCQANHSVDGANGCKTEACRRRTYCHRTCRTCPDMLGEVGILECCRAAKGGHSAGPDGCNNPDCRSRSWCVSSCLGCPHRPENREAAAAAAAAKPPPEPASPLIPPRRDHQRLVNIVSFNIWCSGSQVDKGVELTAEKIGLTNADIICLQECSHQVLSEITELLRAKFPTFANATCSPATGVIARCFQIEKDLPATADVGAGWGCIVCNGPTRIKVINSHLTAYPYSPYGVRDGKFKSEQDVIEAEKHRDDEMQAIVAALVEGVEPELPVILCGDHNCASHLDWVPSTAERNFNRCVRWPVSTRLYASGFHDLFRVANPCPVAHSGHTWTCGNNGSPAKGHKGEFEDREVFDRIDFVYYRAAAADSGFTVAQSFVIDEIGSPVWPSDHRMVVASLVMEPVLPVLVANKNKK